jgi:2,3-bisphosphoglycerate-independent phosphoglycerate mutase
MDLGPLIQPADTTILVVLMDGLGGYPDGDRGTELEDARTPNLDALAAEGVTGRCEIVGPGITPGSGPGHLALFGYDPLEFELGRGALSAAGLDVALRAGDVAARGNLCTLDGDGNIADRRAGRIPSDEAAALVARLQEQVSLEGVEVVFAHEREHRLLVMLRGPGLDPRLADTDPQRTGVPPNAPEALVPEAARAAELFAALSAQVREILAGERANGVLLRGFDTHEDLPSMSERYGVRGAGVAVYPMYRGISRLLGMDVPPKPADLAAEVAQVGEVWDDHDYVFMHVKATDAAGEDGDREAKIAAVETVDAVMPDLLALGPDVVMVTGDHATPPQVGGHAWHPVPVVMRGRHLGTDDVTRFGERPCTQGMLGLRPMSHMMPIMLASAGRLAKYGA